LFYHTIAAVAAVLFEVSTASAQETWLAAATDSPVVWLRASHCISKGIRRWNCAKYRLRLASTNHIVQCRALSRKVVTGPVPVERLLPERHGVETLFTVSGPAMRLYVRE